jgi:Rha family phage regulatory protein
MPDISHTPIGGAISTTIRTIPASDIPNMPVINVRDGAILADSRDIARAFGKQHKNVLTKIDALLADAPDLNGLNFKPVPYVDEKGEARRSYEMDRKGFSLLAMRFTGNRALQWQIAYVDEFDRMERAMLSGEHPVGITQQDRGAIGGIVKGIVSKALTELLPQMVLSEMASSRFALVEGISALEAAEIVGYTTGKRPRGTTQFVSRRLTRFHEDRGVPIRRSRHGAGKVKLYDEATTRAWIGAGGKAETDLYVSERRGQGKLSLVRA